MITGRPKLNGYFLWHPYDPKGVTQRQDDIEIYLHHSNTYFFGIQDGPFQLAKWTVLRPKKDRFTKQNGMY